MGLSCGSQCAKIILFVFNFLFWLAGACMLGLGIWFLVDKNALSVLNIATVDAGSDHLYRAAAIVIIVVGAVVFLTGFLGCCGAMKENSCMLVTYATILTILLLVQITAGILAAVFRSRILDELESSMNKTVTQYYGMDDKETVTESYDFLQKSFKCCGVAVGPIDWEDSFWFNNKRNVTANQVVPDSCCVLADNGFDNTTPLDRAKCSQYAFAANSSSDASQWVHTGGCSDVLEDWFRSHAGILIGVVFGIAVIQVIGIICACCLRKNLYKNEYQYV